MSTIMDKNMFNSAGIPMGKFALKYSNTIDQHGNAVIPSMTGANLKYEALYRSMQLQDLKEFTQRYQWTNVPKGLNAELIERILYYRFKGLFYFNESAMKFQFLPFALNNTIDEYGRYTNCNSLPFVGVSQNVDKKGKTINYVKQDIEIVYDDLFPVGREINEADMAEIQAEWEKGSDKGIILNDYTLGVSQEQPSRFAVVQPTLASMATCQQIINTAMFACADYNILEAQTQDEYDDLMLNLNGINDRILQGQRFGAVQSKLKMDSLRTTSASNLQDLWETFNSLDNFRKSTAGIANSGVFNKKERMLQSEQMLNGSNADDVYADGLEQRQRFCDLVNQYYGLNMWCSSKRVPTANEAMDNSVDSSDSNESSNMNDSEVSDNE